ncbi:MAG TPA: MASE1 domain-containing protein [Phycisphaerae bacterium]|nr:MASE1 domain-containing protein [Phycisphaerae bacterium]
MEAWTEGTVRPSMANQASSRHVSTAVGHLVGIAVLAILYPLLGKLSFSLSVVQANVTMVVFAPEGVSLAALILFGRRLWPGTFIGQFVLAWMSGVPLGVSLAHSAINSAEAAIGATLFQRLGMRRELDRLRDAILLFALCALVLQPFSATLGTVALQLGGRIVAGTYAVTWFSWWLGNTIGQFIVVPLLLTWFSPPRPHLGARGTLEIVVAGASLTASALVVFGELFGMGIAGDLLTFVIFYPVLSLIAVRFGPRGAALGTLLVAAVSLAATTRGHGPFSGGLLQNRLAELNMFLAGSAITSLLIAAVFAERKRTEAALRQIHAELEHRVDERTIELTCANEQLRQEIAQRRQAEQAGRESEQRLRAIADGSPIPTFAIDRNHRVMAWNPAIEEYSGVSAAEVMGTTRQWSAFYTAQRPCLADLVVDGAIDQIPVWYKDKWAQSSLVRNAYEATVYFPHIKGGRWLFFTAAALRDTGGQIVGAVETLQDITERERTEKQAAELSQLKERLLSTSGYNEKLQLITDGVVRAFGADFARIWLTKEADLCDQGCDHAPVMEGPHVCRNRTRCLHLVASSGRYPRTDGRHRRVPIGCYKIGRVASGEEASFVTNDVTQDSRVHDRDWARRLGLVSFAGYRLQSADGNCVGVLALFSKHVLSAQDVALLQTVTGIASQVIHTSTAQEALRESERRLRRAEAVGHLGHWSLDLRTGLPTWSEEMYRIYGLDEQQPPMRHEDHLKVVHPDDREGFVAGVDLIRRGGQGSFEYRLLRPDGGVRQVSSYGEIVRDERGSPATMFGTILDITELKDKERELQEKNAELERFTYTISHDLRSPLVTIEAFLGYLEKDLAGADAERVQADLGHIRNAAVKMGHLLDELLTLSRIGRVVTPPVTVPLQVVVREAIDLVAGRIAERGVQVKVTDAPCTLYGDQRRLMEVFQNLIDNAVKFMGDQPRPSVEVDVEVRGQEVVLLVRDNGSGIDPRHAHRLFGMFEKLQPEMEGTGMGLAIVKRIVELHGGRIWAESEGVGRGSTFCLTLSKTRLER